MSNPSNPLEEWLAVAIERVSAPAILPWHPGLQPERDRLNAIAAKRIAAGAEPRDMQSAYGQRQVLTSASTGGAMLMRASSGDWRPAKFVDVPGRDPMLLFVDQDDAG